MINETTWEASFLLVGIVMCLEWSAKFREKVTMNSRTDHARTDHNFFRGYGLGALSNDDSTQSTPELAE